MLGAATRDAVSVYFFCFLTVLPVLLYFILYLWRLCYDILFCFNFQRIICFPKKRISCFGINRVAPFRSNTHLQMMKEIRTEKAKFGERSRCFDLFLLIISLQNQFVYMLVYNSSSNRVLLLILIYIGSTAISQTEMFS